MTKLVGNRRDSRELGTNEGRRTHFVCPFSGKTLELLKRKGQGRMNPFKLDTSDIYGAGKKDLEVEDIIRAYLDSRMGKKTPNKENFTSF